MSTLSADDAYLDHYRFSHDPFADRVPGFKFFPAQRKPVLAQLHHLARYSQLLLVVTGPEGSGKSLLRQALVASSNKQTVQSVVITPQETTDSSVILKQIGQTLKIHESDYDAIMAQVIELALVGQEVYLLIDDAQRLTGAAIETLLRLAAGSAEGRPHVFLFGDPSLVARLEALVEVEERFHVIDLQPYEEDETREYLGLRLEGAGRDLACLDDEQVERIHEQSGGWPGGINQAAREELIEAMQAAKASGRAGGLGLKLPNKHLFAVAAVLAALGIVLLLRGGDGDEAIARERIQLPLSSAPAVNQPEAGESANEQQQPQTAARPLALPQTEQAQQRAHEPVLAAAVVKESQPQFGEVEAAAMPSVERPAASVVSDAADSPVAEPAEPAPAVELPAQPQTTERPIVAEPAPAPAPTASAAADGWYASQPGAHYLLQIFATQAEENARALVKEHGSDYRYFAKLHQGKPLYVVTFGNFGSRAAALAAVNTLPASLQKGKPWARSFTSVQQEIRQ